MVIPIQEFAKRQSGISMNGVGHGKPGDPMYTLQALAEHAIAFQEALRLNLIWPTRSTRRMAVGAGKRIALPSPKTPAMKFGRIGGIVGALAAEPGMKQQTYLRQAMGVRRLTPVECERLQGFPDGYTDINFKGKPASDSPRYRAIGNSMAVPVLAWIGKRIEAVEAATQEPV